MKNLNSHDGSLFVILLAAGPGIPEKMRLDIVPQFSERMQDIARHFILGTELPFEDQIWADDIRAWTTNYPKSPTVSWENYRQDFPTRYLNTGFFDQYVENMLDAREYKQILDVGGGVEGTQVLKKATKATVYLLDPYVKKAPSWMKNVTESDRFNKYDLIVARGSINYLTDNEIINIKNSLGRAGEFVANTFLTPPPTEWTERPYETITGQKGIERVRYSSEHKVVQHELIPEIGEKISHRFFYRSREDYKHLFGEGVTLNEHKKNSSILHFCV